MRSLSFSVILLDPVALTQAIAASMSPIELIQAAKDVHRDGVNRWFYENVTFSWEKEEGMS